MKKKTSSQSLYVVFGVVIALLIALIGYFVYLLVSPSDSATTTNTNETVTTNTNKDKTKKPKSNANDNTNTSTDTDVVTNDNDNDNTNDSVTNAEDIDGGLVEPKSEEDTTDTDSDETEAVVASEGEQVVTRALFLVDSESQLKAAIAGMGAAGGHQH